MRSRLNTLATTQPRAFAALVTGLLALPIVARLYNSTFTRMIADDFCYAHEAISRGLWGALDFWYNNWSGTPSSTVGQSLVAILGPRANALAPGLYLILWWCALVWAYDQLGRLLRLRAPAYLAFFMGTLTLYGVVEGIPNVYQALYWTSGSVVYTAPMVFIFFQAGLVFYTIRKRPSGGTLAAVLAACAVMTFIVGGSTQTLAVMETALFGLALLGCLLYARRRDMRLPIALVLASFGGAFAALVVALIAPGNAIRQSMHPLSQPLTRVILLTLENTAAFVAMQVALFSLVSILVCLILSATAAYLIQPLISDRRIEFRTALRWMGLSAAVGLILIMAFLAPAAYGMGKMPASRAWVVPQTVLILVVVSWGCAMGMSLKRRSASVPISLKLAALVGILLVVGPVRATFNTLSVSGQLHTFAAEWDARDQHIRAAIARGQTDVSITPFSVDMADFANLDAVDDNPGADFTICLRDYYELESVTILAGADSSAN